MCHSLRISLSKEQKANGVLSCRTITIRERLLRFLLGKQQRITILVPGDSVEEVAICESAEGDETCESN